MAAVTGLGSDGDGGMLQGPHLGIKGAQGKGRSEAGHRRGGGVERRAAAGLGGGGEGLFVSVEPLQMR